MSTKTKSLDYAYITVTRHTTLTPAGEVVHFEYQWNGDPKQPVSLEPEMVEGSPLSCLPHINQMPWKLIVVKEEHYCENRYLAFRQDTALVASLVWRARYHWGRLFRWLALRVAWTALIWGLAKPVAEPRGTWWPIKQWAWQKTKGGQGNA